MTQLWHLVLFWGVIVGFGTGLTAMVLGALVATRWFTARRGLVLGILSASSASGQLLFLPLAAWLAERYGWRVALAPPLSACGRGRGRRAVPGRQAGGRRPSSPMAKAANRAESRPPAAAALAVLGEISRSGAFWVLAGTFFVCGLSTNGLIQTHFIALCADYDVGAVAAASTLAMMGMFDFVGTIGSGWLSDRFDNRALLFDVLRPARPVAALSAELVLHDLRPVAVRRVLWPRLDRDRAADRSPDRAGFRPRARRRRVRLDLRLAHDRRRVRRLGRGLFALVLQTYLPAFYVAGALCLVAASLVWLIEKRPAAAAAAARATA